MSQQNSSRMSLNHRNYQSKGQNSESFYQKIDKSMENYKITCNPVQKSGQTSFVNNQTAQFQQMIPSPPSADGNIFTDPRLL